MALRREQIPAFANRFIEEFNSIGGPSATYPFYEQAVYFAIDQVRRAPNVEYTRIGRHDFYRSENGLGLFNRICRIKSRSRRAGRRSRQRGSRRQHDHDLGNGLLVCTTEDVKAACGAYLEQFPDGTFVCAAGSRVHEQCIFIRRLATNTRRKEIRIYNCNWFDSGSTIIKFLCRIIDCEKNVYHSALHRRRNNELGICGALSWCEILLHFWTMTNPFERSVAVYHYRDHERRLNWMKSPKK